MKSFKEQHTAKANYNMLYNEMMRRNVIDEARNSNTAIPRQEVLNAEMRQLMLQNLMKRMECMRSRQSSLLSTVLSPSSLPTKQEGEIIELLRKRDRLIVRLQRLCVEYEKLMADSAELSEKNQTLKTSCDAVISILDRQDTVIQDMENREEESTREEQRHNLLSAERKYKKQKKENSILRNIYSSIVLATKIDWARKERVRELMLCNEDEPGVPENEL
ncbi:hypothetical protein WA556_000807, partial [Blastocystis sp. ATCC 50177/Nand II]